VDPKQLAKDHERAYARATEAAGKRDLAAALRELEPIARKTANDTTSPLAYWIHNELTWVRWGLGDVQGALAETELGAKALDRSVIAPNEVEKMRLHALWDRAYLLLELGDGGADRAFADYVKLARLHEDNDGIAVLEAFFMVRRRDATRAVAAARRVDVAKDTDLQDLYVIALALDAGGDRATATAVRGRICKGNTYLMKPLVVVQMAREGFSCSEGE
jgi:hypothetical protein